MNRTKFGLFVLGVGIALHWGSARAVTRDLADLQRLPLTLRQSVISELSADVLKDPYDELLRRPYNLGFANIERHGNLSPWPGQEGEQSRYVDFLVGNNGSSNVRNGSDTLQGTYIGQSRDKLTWGVSAAFLADDSRNSDSAAGETFSDGEQLSGADVRFAFGYRISNRTVLGGGVSGFAGVDEFEDSSFSQGAGGFYALQKLERTGVEADFGFRMFTGESKSWDARLVAGFGTTDVNDFSEILDGAGVVTSRLVVTEYDIGNRYLQLAGGYNREYLDSNGEMQVHFGFRRSTQELNNELLSYADDGVAVAPALVLLAQEPVTSDEVFVSADTVFLRGWTQIFGSAHGALSRVSGSSRVDAAQTIVDESIDDSGAALALVIGLRQPLWNEKFRLVARARADWVNESRETAFDSASTATEQTRTTTTYAVGIETVLNNMVFDLAWLFGGDPPPGGADEATRQTIDLDRLVISATFGW